MAQTGEQERPYHHGDLRRALIDAALELIGEKGADLSLRAIARKAGVSTAAPYRHFESREHVLAAVAEEGFRLLADDIRAAMDACGGDPAARLRESGVGYVRFAVRNPSHYQVMFERGPAPTDLDPSLATAAREAFELLLGAIRACQRAGVMAPGDPGRLAFIAWASMHGIASLCNLGHGGLDGPAHAVDLARQAATTLIEGGRPR